MAKCEAITADGDSCKMEAKYPEDNPKYCHLHKNKLEEGEITMEDVEQNKAHIFGSDVASHTVLVDYEGSPDEDGERNYFRARFNDGIWQTNSDKKAKLLMEKLDNNSDLGGKITKVQ